MIYPPLGFGTCTKHRDAHLRILGISLTQTNGEQKSWSTKVLARISSSFQSVVGKCFNGLEQFDTSSARICEQGKKGSDSATSYTLRMWVAHRHGSHFVILFTILARWAFHANNLQAA
jgi:hypothetical protein